MWNPLRSLRLTHRFSSFTPARALPLLCVVRQKEAAPVGVARVLNIGRSVKDETENNDYLSVSILLALVGIFCYNVVGNWIWILEWGGPKRPIPSPPGVQGWRCRCLVLPPSVHLKPSWPNNGGHFLRLDTHTLGRSFWKGRFLASCAVYLVTSVYFGEKCPNSKDCALSGGSFASAIA